MTGSPWRPWRYALALLLLAGLLVAAPSATASSVCGASGRLAYADWSGSAIWTVDGDGRHDRALVAHENLPIRVTDYQAALEGSVGDPAWSPDGRRMAYSWYAHPPLHGAALTSELRVVSTSGRGRRTLVQLPVAGYITSVSWSPDGRRIAFNLWTVNWAVVTATWTTLGSAATLHVVNSDGTGLRPLVTADLHVPNALSWSPDSRRLAFAGDLGGTQGIYTVAADGPPDLTRVSPLTFEAADPSWSPNGRLIAFRAVPVLPQVRDPREQLESSTYVEDVWVASPDGSRARRVLTFEGGQFGPSGWSPDGRHLAGASYFSGLWTVDTVTGRRRQLSRHSHYSAAWSPDGRWIAGWRPGEDEDLAVVVSVRTGRAHVVGPGGQPPVWCPRVG